MKSSDLVVVAEGEVDSVTALEVGLVLILQGVVENDNRLRSV